MHFILKGKGHFAFPPFASKTCLIMKLAAILIILGTFEVSARTHGQGVTYSGRDVPLQKVFAIITEQTGFAIFYKHGILDNTVPVTLNVKNASIQDVLKESFLKQPNGFEFSIEGNSITIIKTSETTKSSNLSGVIDIKGHVLNDHNEPLQDASIIVKGSSIGVKTDAAGNFELKNIRPNSILLISFTGYESKEIKVHEGMAVINISLLISTSPLDQIQVIAYGTSTQRFSVGSYSKVTAADIETQPVTNPLQALEGRVPGLSISQTSGVPGAAIKIQVRGQNTLTSSPGQNEGTLPFDNPLFIIDGIPVATQNNSLNQLTSIGAPGFGIYNSPYGGMSPLNAINPSDIESIEVLRDADATAIYGSRGANGVILITTKGGKTGKTQFSTNVWTGQNEVSRAPKMMNTQQYLEMRHEAFNQDGLTPSSNPSDPGFAPDLFLFDTTQNTNWSKHFLGGTAKVTDVNSSLQGGNDRTTFLIGAGFHHETFITPGDFSENRGSFNMNLRHKSQDQKLNVELSANYSVDQNNSLSPSILSAFMTPPDYPTLQKPDGSLVWSAGGYDLLYIGGNPLAYLKQSYQAKTYNLISGLQLEYQLSPSFALRSRFGYNTTHYIENDANPLAAQDPLDYRMSVADFGNNDFQTWIVEPQIEYKHLIGGGKLDLLAGSTLQQNTNINNLQTGIRYSSDALLGSISGASTVYSNNSNSQYNYSGVFARLNYIWSNKYILDLNARRDGSSRFGPGKQFGNFWSEGAGWIFSEENAVKQDLKWLSYGKLHESYGITGSDNVSPYQYLAGWTPTYYSYMGSGGVQPANLYNSDFSWAVTKKLELGLDLGFIKDRLLVGATWFQNRCGNQLVYYTLPEQTGFIGVTQNFPAVVQNSGWEIQASANLIKSKSFSWTTTFNLTIPKNKLLAFPGIATSNYAGVYIVGKSTTVINTYKYIGVNDTTGLYQFSTIKGVPTYNPDYVTDRQIIGNLDPVYFGGFRNTFSYKGIQLDVFFEFKKQMGTNYLNSMYQYGAPGFASNLPTTFLSRWQKPGDISNIQRLTTTYGDAYNAGNNFLASSGVYSDASYIRLKTLSLSYAFPGQFVKQKLKMAGGRVYINAENLLTITNYKVGDPETQSTFGIPPVRTITAGIQLTF